MLRKTVDGYLYEEFIYCYCGCRKTRPTYNILGRKMQYINGHARRGRKNSLEHNRIIGKTNSGIRKLIVDYSVLHRRVRKRLPRPELCMLCKTNPVNELACITSIYNDELRNWAWFCVTCHTIWDNRIERMTITKRLKKEVRRRGKNIL